MRLYGKKQLEIIKLASKDETRQALAGMFIDRDTTVITDGHKLVTVKSQPKPQEDWPANSIPWNKEDSDPFIISREQVEKAIKNIPKLGKHDPNKILRNVAIGKVLNDQGRKELACQTTDLDNIDNVAGREIDGKFPNYKQVIPDYMDETKYQPIGISATYLKEICAVFEKYQEGSRMITLHIAKQTKKQKQPENYPIVLTANDGEGTEAMAVIMPMRL